MRNFSCFLAFLAVFTAVQMHAGDLTFFGGVQRPGKLTLSTVVDNKTILLNPRNFGTFGLRYSNGRVLGSETTLAYSPNFISSDNKAFILNSNFIVHIPLPVVRPYGTVGLGTVYIGGNGWEALTGAKFAINYGGGVKLNLAGPVGAQIDLRNYFLPSVLSETLNVFEASVGIVFSF